MKPVITLLTLGVTDLARSTKFYETLGFRLSSASQEGVSFFQLNNIVLGLFGREALADDAMVSAKGSGFENITLAINVATKEEVDAALREAETAGGRITKSAQDVFWGGYNGYFADPDGHLWEVAWNPFFKMKEDGTLTLP